ncbi:MAG TPA: ABC transporter ATP-binding protein, partial [Candidatus Binatia bacterium]|nr:ABC transporter ATP-binding protein [Candidatus Binatia bacterium]
RLLDPSEGAVLLDGIDLRDLDPSELRRHIGFVPQETFLFSASIADNIAFGVDKATHEQIRHAAELAGLASDIESFADGYKTMVGERGITLSGGQKQRATLARALLTDAPFLVLDDCLSSVDAQTEDEILRALRSTIQEKTCVIISHRISAVKDADEIVVLDEGRIIERGSHQDLVQNGGLYADLYRQQQLTEELEHLA